ncbi:MAG: AAA family ATPase, partial [Verrucomicrobia bacterium]|nr:AAA family ATPase [Verrucomicrobiota bacterium]
MNLVETEERETIIKAPDHSLANLLKSVQSKIIGQHQIIEQMLVCLLTDGHVLLEGMPGLAKTRSAKAIADGIEGAFHRIQFTPDLLPSDLIGTEIYIHEKSDFVFRKGPIFNNILLADEINRAPAKVQSALLEAMEEKQVTVGHKSYPLPELYMVIATQNPIEQEGTYNLPEAQLDRFMMHLEVGYPSHQEELLIVELDEKRQQLS